MFFFFNRCLCSPGWTGELCELNIDDCVNSPCANNGQCVDAVDDFNCVCEPGFTGKRCQHRIDYCSIEPCQNGGTCSSEESTHKYLYIIGLHFFDVFF